MGGGPSLAAADLKPLEGRRVIAVNSAIGKVPFSDFLVFGDSRWFFHNYPLVKRFKGRIVSLAPAVRDDRCLVMRKVPPPPGLVEERDGLAMRYTSFQAGINLAVHLGAARLVFLGLDGKELDGRTHHHDPHPWPQRPNCWALQYDCIKSTVKPLRKRGIDVINANPGSTYDWWRKEPLEKCLVQYA